jgi:hypothetical protein
MPAWHIGRRPFLAAAVMPLIRVSQREVARSPSSNTNYTLSRSDKELLEDLSSRAFRYFWEQGDPRTGLVRDRARADGSPHVPAQRDVASIAATGFGLSALAIAASRGWHPRADVAGRVRSCLQFLASDMPHEHGWFYHFVNATTGAREWRCELSSIDTALLLAGVLTVRQAFRDDHHIVTAATRVFERTDFPWMLNGNPRLLSMGWKPEDGFLPARWQHYCELMILYLLGIGSPTHPLPPASWRAWTRPTLSYGGFSYVSAGDPLFVHQYSHVWIDFRGRREESTDIDWYRNSVVATRAHKAFCLDLAGEFHGYRDHEWGITASDSAKGYVAWGGPPRHPAIDGSIVPCAAGGSLMFVPEITLPVMRVLRERWSDRIYGRYGFGDAFNPITGWIDRDVLGIDAGITLLSAENLRSEGVWQWFMLNPEVATAMTAVGLRDAR